MLRYLKRSASSSASSPAAKKIKYTQLHPTNHIKILSWNVNGLKAITAKYEMEQEDYSFASQFITTDHSMDNLQYVLMKEQPTILTLQETKIQKNQHEMYEYKFKGYRGFFCSSVAKKGYSGVAIYVRNDWMQQQKEHKSIRIKRGFLAKEQHDEGRIISIEFDHFIILNVYSPNSAAELKRLPYRMDWDRDLLKFAKELKKDTGKAVVLTGDLNVSHLHLDVWNPDTRHPRSACWTQEEKDGFKTFLDAGFVDSFRYKYPTKGESFSQWSYRHSNKTLNRGMRLDYILVSDEIKEGIEDAYIMPTIKGSDHCPVGMNIKLPDDYLQKLQCTEMHKEEEKVLTHQTPEGEQQIEHSKDYTEVELLPEDDSKRDVDKQDLVDESQDYEGTVARMNKENGQI